MIFEKFYATLGYIIRNKEKLGLLFEKEDCVMINRTRQRAFKNIQILKPIYNTLTIKFKDHDIDNFFKDKKDYLKKHGVRIWKNTCQIVEVDGKQGLLHRGKILTGLAFDRIIKLSYHHYLCQNQEQYTIYRFNDIGYETVKRNKPYSENQYISEFNHFSAFIDDIHFKGAVQRAIIDNDFSITDFDMEYYMLGVS